MAEITWTEEAQRWLEDIFEYIAADNPQAAARTVQGIYERAQVLETFPEFGRADTSLTTNTGFRLSAIIGDQYPEIEVPPVEELLTKLQAGEMSGEAVIYPASGDFPRVMIDWHPGHGFVLLCFDSETSRGHFLTRGQVTSRPSVQIVLGGQAMEMWPLELFVSEELAADGLRFLLDTGQRKPGLGWASADEFPREVVWEGRAARDAWEERQRRGPAPRFL